MTAGDFRRLALSFKGTVEGSHQGHPDFRVGGKIFATLGCPEAGWAMVKLKPEQQVRFVHCDGDCFAPLEGGWGRRGATAVRLFGATPAEVRRALALAHRNVNASLHRAGPHRSEHPHAAADTRAAKRAS